MSPDVFRDLCELYALGALDGFDHEAMEEHLRGCQDCQSEVRRCLEQAAMISSNIPLVQPSAGLRSRIAGTFGVAEAIHPRRRQAVIPWAVAAAAVVTLVAGIGWQIRRQSVEAEASRELLAENARTAKALEILKAPGTQQVGFGRLATPSGQLFVHRKLGIVLVASGMPDPPAGSIYESWVVPAIGAPQPVESFQTNSKGEVLSVVPGPFVPEAVKAIAVSVEPKGSKPVTPTRVILIAPIEQAKS